MSINYKKFIGKAISLDFEDHTLGDGPALCRIYGKLSRVTNKYLYVVYWQILKEDKETTKANEEVATILRRAVVNISELNDY